MSTIKNICEETIIQLLKYINNNKSNNSIKLKNKVWHFLICNKSCGLKVSSLISKSSLISENIIEIQFLESTNRNQKEKFPGVYFIDLTKETLKLLEKDLKEEVYKETRIIIGNIPRLILKNKIFGKYIEYEESLLKKLQKISLNPKYKIKNIESIQLGFNFEFFNYISYKNCFYSAILSFFDFLNISSDLENNNKIFSPNFIEQKKDENLIKLFKTYDYKIVYNNNLNNINIDVIRFERSFDFITPLMYFFTFYPLLEGIGILNNLNINQSSKQNEEDNNNNNISTISLKGNGEFLVFRFKHLAEITTLIPKRLDSLIKKTNKIDEITDTSELARMVLEAPILLKQKEETELLINLVEKSLKYFKTDLNELAEIQNQIILSENKTLIKKEKYNLKKEKVLKILLNFINKKTTSLLNLKKLIMIYLIKYYIHGDFSNEELKKDLEIFKVYFNEKENKNLKSFLIKNLNKEKFKKSDLFDKNYNFDVSIIKPRLEVLLLQFLKEGEIMNFKGRGTITNSLRKGGFLNKNNNEKRKILISLDWFCAKELEVCEVLSNQFNVNIILLGKLFTNEMIMKNILD